MLALDGACGGVVMRGSGRTKKVIGKDGRTLLSYNDGSRDLTGRVRREDGPGRQEWVPGSSEVIAPGVLVAAVQGPTRGATLEQWSHGCWLLRKRIACECWLCGGSTWGVFSGFWPRFCT